MKTNSGELKIIVGLAKQILDCCFWRPAFRVLVYQRFLAGRKSKKASKITSLLTLLIMACAIAAFCLATTKTNADNRVEIFSVKNRVLPVSESKTFVVSGPIATNDDGKGFWLTLRASG